MINSLYKETFHLKRRPIEKQVIDLNEELLNKQNTPPYKQFRSFSQYLLAGRHSFILALQSFSVISSEVIEFFRQHINLLSKDLYYFRFAALFNLFPAGFYDLISAGIVNDFLRIRRKQSQLLFFLRRFVSKIVCELYCCLYSLEVNESRIFIKRTFIEANCSLQTIQAFSRESEEGHHE